MAKPATSSIASAPNFLNDDILVSGYLLALRAAGRSQKTIETYHDSVKILQQFCVERRMPALVALSTEHLREFLTALYAKGNKASTVSVRFRGLQRFYRWLLAEGERADDPLARLSAPKVPEKLQPHYSEGDLRKVLATLPTSSRDPNVLRSRALLLTLLDTGLRGNELCGLQVDDLDLRSLTLTVRQAKGGRDRIVGLGAGAAQSVERYLRRRKAQSRWLFAARDQGAMTYHAVRALLERLFENAGVPFHGVHGLRRTFAIEFLNGGGDPEDLRTLAGWTSSAMLRRYTRATETQRALKSHRRFSPVDRMGLGR